MTVKLVALYLLVVLPYFVSRTPGGICILSQLHSDGPYESAAGFQHALPQGPLSQPPLFAALPDNLPGHSLSWRSTALFSPTHIAAFPYPPDFWICQAGGISALFGPSLLQPPLPSCIPHSIPRRKEHTSSTEQFTPELWKC